MASCVHTSTFCTEIISLTKIKKILLLQLIVDNNHIDQKRISRSFSDRAIFLMSLIVHVDVQTSFYVLQKLKKQKR